METIDNNTNASQLLEAVNTAFGNTTGIQEILASDNAADLVEKLNHNFEVMGTGGDAVFPDGTIMPVAIGGINAGENIGGITLDDFITYGIENKPRTVVFFHGSDPHANGGGGGGEFSDAYNKMLADPSIACFVETGDMYSGQSNALTTNMKKVASLDKLLVLPGNHDIRDAYSGNVVRMREAIEYWMQNGDGVIGDNIKFGYNGDNNDDLGNYGCYWHTDSDLGNGVLRIIGIDLYNYPGDNSDNSKGWHWWYSQHQIDWLIGLLKELGENDYFILAMHETPVKPTAQNPIYPIDKRQENKFCSSLLDKKWYTEDAGTVAYNPNFLAEIVDKYLNSENINIVAPEKDGGASVTADFRKHKPAQFLCYLCGHWHADFIEKHPVYGNQLISVVETSLSHAGSITDIRKEDVSGYTAGVRPAGMYNQITVDAMRKTIKFKRIVPGRTEPINTCAHTVNSSNWPQDAYDKHGEGYVYPSITRDEITFDFNANEIITNNEQENEN
jgi:hypothetical protein